jgi:hypothetical protein
MRIERENHRAEVLDLRQGLALAYQSLQSSEDA